MPGRTLVTPPAVEPVTVADADLYARISSSTEDPLVTTLITAARKRCEEWRGQAFITQVWDEFYDSFPRWADAYTLDGAFTPMAAQAFSGYPAFGRREPPILLHRPPVQSVTS